MNIEGYTYIAHKLIQRPWGPECRFTFARPDGSHINDVVPIPSIKTDEKELAGIIEGHLKRIDVPFEPFVDPKQAEIDAAVAAKEAEIKAMLVSKALITSEQKIEDVLTKADYAKATADVEVKP